MAFHITLCLSISGTPRTSKSVSHQVITADLGKSIELACETTCKPEPNFLWYRGNITNPLKTCEPVYDTMDKDSKRDSFCNLTIVVKTHGETLTCLKTNSIGKEKQTFTIWPRGIKSTSCICS